MIFLVVGIVAVLFIGFCIAGVRQASNVFNVGKYWSEKESKWSGKSKE